VDASGKDIGQKANHGETMGLEEVKNEILRKAESDAKVVISEGHKEAEAVMNDADKKIQDYQRQCEESTGKMIEAVERREKAAAEFEARKRLLDKKREAIDGVVEDAKNDLAGMKDDKKESFIRKLIAAAGKEIDVKVIYANSKDRKFIAKLPGIEYREKDIAGGIIAETGDGRINVDYSYEELLGSIKTKQLQKIESLLFKNR